MFGYNNLNPEEWNYFLAGPVGEIEQAANPTDWLGELEWNETYKQLYGMSTLPIFKGFDEYFIKNHKLFQVIFDNSEPQNMPIPGEWNDKLTTF